MRFLVFLTFCQAIELNAFFLKFILWVPPPHHLNLGRIVFWWLVGCAGTRELYFKTQTDAPLGMMFLLILVNALLELVVCFKFGVGMFPNAAPAYVKWPWIVVLSSLALFAVVYFPINASSKDEVVAPVEAEGAAPAEAKKLK
jgi:phosphatidylserine synthase 2